MSSAVERTYVIEGMSCGHCKLSVREEVEELTGVQSARADRVTGRLVVRGDVDAAAVHEAVRGCRLSGGVMTAARSVHGETRADSA